MWERRKKNNCGVITCLARYIILWVRVSFHTDQLS